MDVKPGYKQTEVGVIPEDWEVKSLGEIASFKNGINKGKSDFGYGYPFVNLMDVFGIPKIYKATSELGLINTNAAERELYNLKGGDVLFVRSSVKPGGVGLTTLISSDLPDTVFSGFLIRFRDSGHIEVGFKEHCFFDTNFRSRLISSSTVSANTNINQDSLKQLRIALPPTKTEQRAIATALSDADALIQSLERLIAKKRDIKQGAMQELLTGKKRLPGFEKKKGYKQTEVGVIPEDWELVTLVAVADVRDGTHDSPRYVESGVPFVTSKNILAGQIDFTSITFISSKDAQEVDRRSKVDRGDILISMIGTVGNAALVDFEPNFSIKNVGLIKPYSDSIESRFVIQYLHSDKFKTYLENRLAGGIQKFVSLGMLRSLELPIPPTNIEQRAIATVLSDMDAEIAALDSKLAKARQIKQGMMQELLTGRIRLT